MNKATKIAAAVLLTLALLLAVLAILLARQPAPTPAQPVVGAVPEQPAVPTYPVAVAAQPIPAGKPIEAASLKVVQLPIRPEGTRPQVEDWVGKIPSRALGLDHPLTDADLQQGIVAFLREGERAVPMMMESASGLRIAQGDVVDVFFTLRDPIDAQDAQSRLLLPATRVLDAPPLPENSPPNSNRTVVLAVALPDINRVMLASQHGKLSFVLRPAGEAASVDPTLFVQPAPVLATRAGLNEADRARSTQPANQAFAGLGLKALAQPAAGSPAATTASSYAAPSRVSPSAPARSTPRATPPSQIEIIRGGQSEVMPF